MQKWIQWQRWYYKMQRHLYWRADTAFSFTLILVYTCYTYKSNVPLSFETLRYHIQTSTLTNEVDFSSMQGILLFHDVAVWYLSKVWLARK